MRSERSRADTQMRRQRKRMATINRSKNWSMEKSSCDLSSDSPAQDLQQPLDHGRQGRLKQHAFAADRMIQTQFKGMQRLAWPGNSIGNLRQRL